jgi:hypothetical protein
MTTTTHETPAHRFASILNGRNAEALTKILHPDYIQHNRYVQPGIWYQSRRCSRVDAPHCGQYKLFASLPAWYESVR